jgi:hypothetical protein
MKILRENVDLRAENVDLRRQLETVKRKKNRRQPHLQRDSLVRKDFARACKERDELKAKAQATFTVEPLSVEELAKLVEHYLESDMGYTGFDLARDVAEAQRAKVRSVELPTVEELANLLMQIVATSVSGETCAVECACAVLDLFRERMGEDQDGGVR